MANNKSLTSANAILTLTVVGYISTPVQIQGFQVDSMFDADAYDRTEVVMGADGRLSAGKVHNPRPFAIHLQADSESRAIFTAWAQAEDQVGEVFPAYFVVTLKATGERFFVNRAFFVRDKAMPDAKKILQGVDYNFMAESITSVPL